MTRTFQVTPEIESAHWFGALLKFGFTGTRMYFAVRCVCGAEKHFSLELDWVRDCKNDIEREAYYYATKKIHEHRMDVAAKEAHGLMTV